jgi:hypothetical protein
LKLGAIGLFFEQIIILPEVIFQKSDPPPRLRLNAVSGPRHAGLLRNHYLYACFASYHRNEVNLFVFLTLLNHFTMSLQDKYRSVLQLGEELGIQEGFVEEKDGKLHIGGIAQTQYEKNLLWDKIKEVGGDSFPDIAANINVAVTDYYHKHTVSKGETLSKISKQYYDDASKYMKIFKANSDILKDPDMIQIGQELIIPNE